MMLRHILLMLFLVAGALAAGAALVPGEREQWTMLVRDSRNAEALRLLETRYREGRRDPDIVLQFYRLLMLFAEIERATQVIEEFASSRASNVEVITLLARHHADTQNKSGEVRTLERLFELAPSPRIARDLLAFYRSAGAFEDEEMLLRWLLPTPMIAAGDAERLGLLLASHGDFEGAREALMKFDTLANPEHVTGRFALFDILVKTGETKTALAKAGAWMSHWREASIHGPGSGETATVRLAQMMLDADEDEARKVLCEARREEASATGGDRVQEAFCGMAAADSIRMGLAGGRRSTGVYGDERASRSQFAQP